MDAVYRVDYPDGRHETMGYNALGSPTAHTNAAGSVTRYEYLPSRKLEKIVHEGWDGLKVTNRFEYNRQFNTLGIVEPRGLHVETYVLDAQDRPVAVTNIEDQTMTVAYGIGDMVKSVKRFDGTVVSNSWDRHGRFDGVHYPDQTLSMAYYDNGLVKSVSGPGGTVSHSYDGANRLVGTVSPGASVTYELDGVGNATEMTAAMGSSNLTYSFGFDAAERRTNQTSDAGEFVYTYHPHNGLIASISNIASGVRVRYDFDVMDRITNIVWRNDGGEVRRSFAQSYSPDGLITNIVREHSAYDNAYRHDSLGMLTYGEGKGWRYSYAWDLAGNPADSTNGEDNRIYPLTYSYANSGCITEIDPFFHDPVDLNWNSLYQLTSVETNGVELASYEYDPLGRRCIRRTADGTNTVTNVYVYAGAQIVADLDGTGKVVRTYAWAPGIDRLLAMTVHTGETAVTYYALTDHQGSVHAWLNEGGDIVEHYEYNTWGKLMLAKNGAHQDISASTIGNRYLWHGREYEWATHKALNDKGLYYFRARWYRPDNGYGRWLSKDPIGIAGGLNQYVAFGNNPVSFADAFGLLTDEQLKELGQHMQRSSKELERIQLGYLGIMGAAVAAPSAGPAIANVARAGATKLLAGGAAIVEAGRNALSRLAAWQPFQGFVNTTSIQGSYLNAQMVTAPSATSATFGELVTAAQPYAAQFGSGLVTGPGGPYRNAREVVSWTAGAGTVALGDLIDDLLSQQECANAYKQNK